MLLEKKQLLTKSFDKAFMSYAESEWSAGAFDKKVEEIVSKKAEVGLELRGDNVAGVFLPTFILKKGNDNTKKISRMQGAIAIQKTRESYATFKIHKYININHAAKTPKQIHINIPKPKSIKTNQKDSKNCWKSSPTWPPYRQVSCNWTESSKSPTAESTPLNSSSFRTSRT